MTKYSGLLKAKLQELLTARGLPVDGTKEVLIERLEESDKIAAELDEDEDEVAAEAPAAVETPVEPAAPAATPAEPVEEKKPEPAAPAPAAETPVETPLEEKKEEVTPETLKAAAIEHLSKKIARAQKFGEDQQASSLQAELARIEKFGVAIDSAISRELGFAPAPKQKPRPTGPSNADRRRARPNKRPAPRPAPRHNGNNGRRYSDDRDRAGFHPGYRRGGYNDGRHVQGGRVYKTRY